MADEIVGFRARDPVTGTIIVDITDRLTRVIGTVNSGTANGSISVPGFALGEGWGCVFENQPANQSQSTLYGYPIITIDKANSLLVWSFPTYQGQSVLRVACDIMYGVY